MTFIKKLSKKLKKLIAHIRLYVLRTKCNLQKWIHTIRLKIGWIVVVLFIVLLAVYDKQFSIFLSKHFPNQESINPIKNILITLGGGLIGASFITFYFNMFSMQINLKGMPNDYFNKDRNRANLFFIIKLILGIIVCLISALLNDPQNLGVYVFIALIATSVFVLLVLYAYDYTIKLIDPYYQLETIFQSIKRDLKSWEHRAEITRPLLPEESEFQDKTSPFTSTHDLSKAYFMYHDRSGMQSAIKGVNGAIAYSLQYAERENYEVSSSAFEIISKINQNYIECKGKTFYSQNPFFENPLANDDLITRSLEGLRRSMYTALRRNDEQLIIQILQTYSSLIKIYLQIDYSNDIANKTHAKLAEKYLSDGVQDVFRLEINEVVLAGVRILGGCFHQFCQAGEVEDSTSIIESIGTITARNVINKKYFPVTYVGMEQLSNMTMELLSSESHSLRFVFTILQKNISLVVTGILTFTQENDSIRNLYMTNPYYIELQARISNLANYIINEKKDIKNPKHVISNFITWSSQIYDSEGELFMQAITAKSSLLNQLVGFTRKIGEILVALSSTSACDEYSRKELQENALKIISNLSLAFENKQSFDAFANFRLEETLTNAAMDGYQWNSIEYMNAARDYLLRWAFLDGKYLSNWGIFEKSLYGLAALAIKEESVEKLIQDVNRYLNSFSEDITKEILDQTARAMRKKASELFKLRTLNVSSSIERLMQTTNEAELKKLLQSLANILSPDTAGESVTVDYF